MDILPSSASPLSLINCCAIISEDRTLSISFLMSSLRASRASLDSLSWPFARYCSYAVESSFK